MEILSDMPLGLEANMQMLAIRDADYGAILDSSIEPCLDDPSMVNIVTKMRVDTLDTIGWKGFTAANFEGFK